MTTVIKANDPAGPQGALAMPTGAAQTSASAESQHGRRVVPLHPAIGIYRMPLAFASLDYQELWDKLQAEQQAATDAAAEASLARAQAMEQRRKKRGQMQLTTEDELLSRPPQSWLVKGIIPDAGTGAFYGPSGTFKSFLVLDMLAHISRGVTWFGKKVQGRPCIYIPFEGKGGIPKRVQAWRQAHNGQPTHIHFIDSPINLRDPQDRNALVQLITTQQWQVPPVLCIDTLAQAGGSFDENSSKDMGEMIAIIQELQESLGGVVLVVHHSGKDVSKGMRGHSSLRGALDFAIECYRDDNDAKHEAHFRLDKVKDGEDGVVFDFNMTAQNLGQDADGEFITSLTVNQQFREPASDVEAEAVLQIIQRGPISQAEVITTLLHIPAGRVRGAVTKLVKDGKVEWVGKTGRYAKLRAV